MPYTSIASFDAPSLELELLLDLPSSMDAGTRLVNRDLPGARLEVALGQVAVPDDAALAVLIHDAAEALDVLLDLALEGRRGSAP